MPRTYRDRGAKDKKAKKPSKRQSRSDSTFGEIPLVERTITNAYGKTVSFYEYDPDFRPPIPPGAVEGNVSRQVYCPLCHTPRYYYLDQNRKCVQCNEPFTFSATEQKYWYESLQFNFYSVAVRCPKCRKRRRNEKALHNQIGAALERIRITPNDPEALVDLARSTVRLHQKTGKGDLNRAISSCRKAVQIWHAQRDALFWEGMAHYQSHRSDKAKLLLEQYLERRKKKDGVSLMNEAISTLKSIKESEEGDA